MSVEATSGGPLIQGISLHEFMRRVGSPTMGMIIMRIRDELSCESEVQRRSLLVVMTVVYHYTR